MATKVGLKFFKLASTNANFNTALATPGAIVHVTDKHEIWVGGATAAEAQCVVKGTSNVSFSGNILTITSRVLNGSTWTEDTKTLDFNDVASAQATLQVFDNVYTLMGASTSGNTKVIDYSGTTYIKAGTGTSGQAGYIAPSNNQTLADADRILDANIKRIDDAIGGSSVVNSLDGQSGTILVGNGLNVDVTGTSPNEIKTLNLVPETGGYIVTSQTVGAVDKTGINIADSKIDKNYTTANTSNLATVASITSALDTLDVSTDTGAASVSGSAITIKAVQQEDGKIKDGGTTTINLEGTYDASTNKIATQSTVSNAIAALDVNEYDQASVDVDTTNHVSTLKIKGIKEVDGKIAASTTTPTVDVAIDGEYSASTNKIATQSTVTNAIGGLYTQSDVQAVTYSTSGSTTTLTFNGVSETNGVIAQGSGTGTVTIGDGALKLSGYGATDTTGSTPTIPTVDAADVFSANDTADSTIALGNEFILNTTNKTIGLRTNQSVAADNNIATMKDIASLSGAMHYMGGVTAYPTPTANTKAGDTYVVTTQFEYPANSGTIYEVGDMLVADDDGTGATYTVVQSNMTLGVGQGQVAANSAALTSGNIVVASGTGVQTGSYSLTNLATHNVAVSSSNEVVTITDTLTVGGTAQSSGTQAFTITGGNALTASASGNDITINHDARPTTLTPAAVKVAVDSYGHAQTGDALASTDISHSATIGSTAVSTVGGAINALETLAEGALQSISHGTDGTYVTTTIGAEDANHDQSVGVAVTIQAVSTADSTYMGLAEASDVKGYVDGKINGLDAVVDADVASASGTTVATTATTPDADFKVLNSVTETDGKLSAGTAYNVKKLAATAAATDMTVTSANYGGTEATTNAQTALNNLASAISSAAITIDSHVGAITTGDGLTDVAADGGSFGVKIDSTNANGLSVGANGVAMAKATGSTFGTVEVTSGNGLTLTDGVVAYAHNTSAITVASESNGVVTINGTLTPDASDALSASNQIALAKVATTGTAADVAIADSNSKFTATDVEGALEELKDDIADLDATVATYTTSGTTVTYTGTNNVAVSVTEADGKLTAVTANLYWDMYE